MQDQTVSNREAFESCHLRQQPPTAFYGHRIYSSTDNIYHAALLKNHPLKFKSRQKLPSSSKILAWIQPCICLHFTPLGLLGKTVGDWKPWSDQNCLGHTKGSSFVHHPKQPPNRFPPPLLFLFSTSGIQPREVEVWLSLLCFNMFHAFQLLTSSIWEIAKCDGMNINSAWVMSLKRHRSCLK